MERILIVRLGAMGDVIHALPAARELRQALPSARIDWVIESKWVELLRSDEDARAGSPQRPLVDNAITVDTRKWRKAIFSPDTWHEMGGVRKLLHSANYDAVLDMQGALKSAMIARFSGAGKRIGLAHPRETQAAWFYQKSVATTSEHVIDQNRELAAAVTGGKMEGAAALAPGNLPRDAAAESWAEELASGKKIAVLNPGAGWGAKQWSPENYAAVARWLGANGFLCLVNAGPSAAELALASRVEAASSGNARTLAGASISKLVALLRRASLLVGGDTGPMHLANALGVPVIALFGPTDPARNGPYFTPSIVLRNEKSKTSYSHHGAGDEGLLAITAEQVIAACQKITNV